VRATDCALFFSCLCIFKLIRLAKTGNPNEGGRPFELDNKTFSFPEWPPVDGSDQVDEWFVLGRPVGSEEADARVQDIPPQKIRQWKFVAPIIHIIWCGGGLS